MTGLGIGATLVRTTGILGLAVLLLALPPALVPLLPHRIQQGLPGTVGTLCGGRCTCTYCDQLINGRCYTHGHLGPGSCSAACGTNRCRFQPNQDGCGPIQYLGCDDDPCTGSPPALPRPTSTPPPIPPGMGPTPTPALPRTPTPVPTAVPAPACTRTWVVLRPPTVEAVRHEPPFPVLQAQEFATPDHGVTFHVTVKGGKAIQYAQREVRECRASGSYPQDCPNDWTTVCEIYVQAQYNDPVTQVTLALDLQAASQSWIATYLESRYPRARVRQSHHDPGHWQGSTMSASLTFPDWYPRDPGVYAGIVTADTGGTPISPPQTVTRNHAVTVSLRDTTLAP